MGVERQIQRYAMEPTYRQSNCSIVPSVALVKHPKGQVVLYADYAAEVKRLQDAWEEAVGICCICQGTIWRKQERITDERGTFHPICQLRAANERLKGLLREYRAPHGNGFRCRLYSDGEDLRCDLCKRTDQELQPTQGEQG